jgi:hypothetical protein
MTWYNDNGTASHTHELINFRSIGEGVGGVGVGRQQPITTPIVVEPDNGVSLRGVVDIGANHRIVWKNVQSTIDIKKGGKIISILLNDAQTNNHFGGRPIYGIVTSFIRCSDMPGPNMEVLPPCMSIPSQSAAAALPTTTFSTPPTIATANNTGLQSPTNFTTNPPLSSSQSGKYNN